MSGKHSELAVEAEALKSGASASIFGLDQLLHFVLWLPLCKMKNEDATAASWDWIVLLKPGLSNLIF